MGRGKHCTAEKRNIIKNLRNANKTYKEIEEIVGCTSTVIRNALKWTEKTETRGRKRKTDSRIDRKIIRMVKERPHSTAKNVQDELNLEVSTRTIRRRFREAGLNSRSPRKVPLLTPKHALKRIAFAKKYVDWPKEKFRNILWSDESKIMLFGGKGTRQYVHRPINAEYRPQYTVKTIKHGGCSIMIWGCFSYYGTGPLHKICGIMDRFSYCDILNNVMLPYAEEEMPLKWVFQQDNDPKHTSKMVKKLLMDKKVDVMDWPAQSPDLNPIENLWAYLKKEVGIKNPKNNSELWVVVQEIWSSIPKSFCQNLVDSMPRRCAAVLKNKGYTTKY